MGVEFLESTAGLQDQIRCLKDALRANGGATEIRVLPDGMALSDGLLAGPPTAHADDALLDLFREQAQLPVEVFLQQMQDRHLPESR